MLRKMLRAGAVEDEEGCSGYAESVGKVVRAEVDARPVCRFPWAKLKENLCIKSHEQRWMRDVELVCAKDRVLWGITGCLWVCVLNTAKST
jgi:hypothetical protein